LGWIVLLRHNKPAGYAEDWLDQKFNGELRREHLVLFVTTEMAAYGGDAKARDGLDRYYESMLGQLR